MNHWQAAFLIVSFFAIGCWLQAEPELLPAPKEVALPSIDGFYAVQGQTPNGGVYLGTALIRQHGETYLVSWIFESGVTNSGTGLRDGSTLAVGFTTPDGGAGIHRFEVRKDKSLVGRWGAGAGKCGSETLTFLRGLSQ